MSSRRRDAPIAPLAMLWTAGPSDKSGIFDEIRRVIAGMRPDDYILLVLGKEIAVHSSEGAKGLGILRLCGAEPISLPSHTAYPIGAEGSRATSNPGWLVALVASIWSSVGSKIDLASRSNVTFRSMVLNIRPGLGYDAENSREER